MLEENWLADVYEKNRDGLVRCAWNITKNQTEAEDAVHAAFLAMANRCEQPVDPKLYAYRSVRNSALNIRRANGRSARFRRSLASNEEAIDNRTGRQNGADLEDMLRALPDEAREVVELHLHSNLTFREIGALTETPTQTIASRYRRAIARLRELLGEEYT